jgi:cytochrome o ubiquinol oxidase subunit 3
MADSITARPDHPIHQNHSDFQAETYSKTIFGFWVYIMSDCVLFTTLFATYAVLHNNTFGGPSGKELFSPPFTLTETMILLVSSFTCGLALMAAHRNERKKVVAWLCVTLLLGFSLIAMELTEFHHLVVTGNSWERSAFLSSFFTLVATHGTHITIGSLWMIVMIGQVLYRGLTPPTLRRLKCFSLFWHFLDVVWIFIFTLVYMMEAI